MTKRIGGFLVPDDMELTEETKMEDGSLSEEETQEDVTTIPEEGSEDDPHSQEGSEEPEEHEEVSEETEEETSEEVSEENEETEDKEENKKDEKTPVAVLTVYGKKIPVYSMDELIAYAQRGFDYSNKLYLLKQWRSTIEAVSYNPQLKMLVDKVIKGEDISKYIVDPDSPQQKPKEEEDSFEFDENEDFGDLSPTDLRKTFEKITDKKVKEALAPYIAKLKEQELKIYLKTLEAKNPKYHNAVTQLILMSLQDPTVPAPVKEAIRTDRNFFETMYYQIKERLEQIDQQKQQASSEVQQQEVSKESKPQEQKSEAPKTKKVLVEKKRSVSKVPKLEGSRDSEQISTERRVLEEAEKIWQLSPEEFRKLEEKVKRKL